MDGILTIVYVISALILFGINALEKKDLINIKKCLFSAQNGGCKNCPFYGDKRRQGRLQDAEKLREEGGDSS